MTPAAFAEMQKQVKKTWHEKFLQASKLTGEDELVKFAIAAIEATQLLEIDYVMKNNMLDTPGKYFSGGSILKP